MKANCVVCGKEFEARDFRCKCCSKECGAERKRRSQRKNLRANCVVCGKEFEKRRAAKTCGKECFHKNIYNRNCMWRAANPEKKREQNRRYRAINPGKARESRRKCYATNPEKERKQNRKYRADNPEKVREWRRNWCAANPEKAQEIGRKHRAANPERIQKRDRENQRYRRAAKALGISLPEYALRQMINRLTQSQEQPNDQASDRNV
jgi:hypothetical protein